MERLTFDGCYCDIAHCRNRACIGICFQKEIWEKLKAYEDTGLTPEAVRRFAIGDPKQL